MNPKRLQSLQQPVVTANLGVAIELVFFRTLGKRQAIDDLVEVDFSRVQPLIGLWRQGLESSLSSDLPGMGFIRVSEAIDRDEIEWTRFGLYAQQCAHQSGVPKQTAAQLVAALGELRSNVLEHSGCADGGIIAFLAHTDGVEFVAADQGIGLLASLKQNQEYANLTDHGIALRTALTEGTSRHGTGIGRGFGFRPIFIGLANAVGEIRFRTGDHALSIAGESPSLIQARVAQKANFGGLFAHFRWRSSRVSLRQT